MATCQNLSSWAHCGWKWIELSVWAAHIESLCWHKSDSIPLASDINKHLTRCERKEWMTEVMLWMVQPPPAPLTPPVVSYALIVLFMTSSCRLRMTPTADTRIDVMHFRLFFYVGINRFSDTGSVRNTSRVSSAVAGCPDNYDTWSWMYIATDHRPPTNKTHTSWRPMHTGNPLILLD